MSNSANLYCEKVTDFSKLEAYSHKWMKWRSETSTANIFQTWGWIRAFWHACAPDLSLHALAVHQGSEVLGILPLVKRGDTVGFIGCPDSDYNDILCEPANAGRVLETALQYLFADSRFAWRTGLLENLPADALILQALPTLSSDIRRRLQVVARYPAPTILLKEDNANRLESLLNKERRAGSKRLFNQVRFRHLETRQEAREHLDTFYHQHITRWAMSGHSSQFLDPHRRAFFANLIEDLNPAKELRFAVLELESRPVAYHFGFEFGRKLIWYKPTFDINYWDYKVGNILLQHLFRYAQSAGLDEFDFSIGDEPYKYRFANHVRQTFVLHLQSKPTRLVSFSQSVVRSLEHAVRVRPALKIRVKEKREEARILYSKMRRIIQWRSLRKHLSKFIRQRIWASGQASIYECPGMETMGQSRADIIQANLDQVASVLVRYLNETTGPKLHEFRQRIKQGDTLWLAQSHSQEPFILSVGKRATISMPEIGPKCSIGLKAPSLVLYECYSPAEMEVPVPPEIAQSLAQAIGRSELWIYTARDCESKHLSIQNAGFLMRYRLFHVAFFRRFHRTWIKSPLNSRATVPPRTANEVLQLNQ